MGHRRTFSLNELNQPVAVGPVDQPFTTGTVGNHERESDCKQIDRIADSPVGFSDDNETWVEQLPGCPIPGCHCEGRIEFMEWGSEDMTETDDSEYEDPMDRTNRLYVENYNYDLFDGMTPMTHTPTKRKGRRRRYEVRKKKETELVKSSSLTSDRGFQADKESPESELMVQPRMVADEEIPNVRDKIDDRGRRTRTGSDKDISSDEDLVSR